MPQKLGRALAYALLIWILGFIWGTVVFMTPALKSIASIPHVSRFPAISFPILVMWTVVAYLLARSYLKGTTNPVGEGLKLGITFTVINIMLDLLVLVILLRTGLIYFDSASVWFAYGLLIIVPWLTGRSLARQRTA
jgi:hypothetical protein